jgi:hypothetical protein
MMRVMGVCACCAAIVSFDPDRVPTIKINGQKQPLCESCVGEANARRNLLKLQPIVIPEGTYDA